MAHEADHEKVFVLKVGNVQRIGIGIVTFVVGVLVWAVPPILMGTVREQAFAHWSHWVFGLAGAALGFLTARGLSAVAGRRLLVGENEVVLARGTGAVLHRCPRTATSARITNVVPGVGQAGHSYPVPALEIRLANHELVVLGFGRIVDPSRPASSSMAFLTYHVSPHDWNELASLFHDS